MIGLLAFGAFTYTQQYQVNNVTVIYMSSSAYQIWEVPLFLILGVVGGLLGALFNFTNHRLALFRKRFIIPYRWRRILEVVIVTLITSVVAFSFPYAAQDCK